MGWKNKQWQWGNSQVNPEGEISYRTNGLVYSTSQSDLKSGWGGRAWTQIKELQKQPNGMCGPWVNPGLNKPTDQDFFWISWGNLNRDYILDVMWELL